MKSWISTCKKYQKDMIAIAVLVCVVTALLMHFVDFEHMNLSVPMYYQGNDDLSVMVTAKLIKDSGWNFGTEQLSAPNTYYHNTDEIIAGLHNADVATLKFFLAITNGDVAKSVNLLYLSTFYITALVAYAAFRLLHIREWISALSSLVFAFLPFAFMRNVEHITLTCYYFVPLAIVLAIWVYEDEQFFYPARGFFRNKKNILGLVMTFLIANSGIGYWQIFACFYIFVAMLLGYITKRNKKVWLRGVVGIASIIVCIVFACIPEFITLIGNHSTGVESRVRNIGNAEVYCLKMIQLFLPVNGHGISSLQSLIDAYNEGVPLINENQSSYIGMIGIVGFFILLVYLFVKKKEDTQLQEHLTILSGFHICTLLLATIGGFGTMAFVLGFQFVRGYNRISVHIAFLCILAVALVVDDIDKKITDKRKSLLYKAGVTICMLVAVLEQNPGVPITYQENKQSWENDEAFFAEAERVFPKKASIFQLPYVDFPESAGANEMLPLSHYIGYIHTDTLRWSFGSLMGTETSNWYEQTAALAPSDMVTELKDKGFDGIYINRDGYEQKEWMQLEQALEKVIGKKAVVSQDGRLVIFQF